MENDTSFADLDHFNVIGDKFGIHFNSVLRKHVIGTNWEQQLKFEGIEDFEPAEVARQVEPLRKLLETRDKLRDLLTKIDRSDDLENLLEQVLKNSEEIKRMSSDMGKQGTETASETSSEKGGN